MQGGIQLADGRSLLIYQDIDRTCKQIEKFSPKDARTYRDVYERFTHMNELLMVSFFNPPTKPSVTPAMMEGTSEGMELLRMIASTPERIVDDLFETDALKSWLLVTTAQLGNPTDRYGSGAAIAHDCTSAHHPRHAWGVCVCLSRMAAEAMAKVIEAYRGKCVRDAHVEKILVEDGRATGVELADGTKITARKLVISNAGHPYTVNHLVGEEEWGKEGKGFVEGVKRFRPDEIVLFTPHLALNEAPKWKDWEGNPDILKAFVVVFGTDTPEMLRTQFEDIRALIPPRNPGGFSCMHSVIDPTICPQGKHVAFLWQFTCYDLRGDARNWDNEKQKVGDHILAKWREYAPNLTEENIIDRYYDSPL
ncbi:MAG: NAD(P)/FAD-dependent oxidoreductase, partial [Thermodesulfobacteriota bacterium]|nr:NAD(P)/FAD-dependent oxidoreductase [Thermodesulfobacteriota bacterium]